MLEVRRRIGATRRKPNDCAQDVLGSSPMKSLRAVRINGLRRERRSGARAVRGVSSRWGFWQPDQSSLDHKRQFGEMPSTTLKAARGTKTPARSN